MNEHQSIAQLVRYFRRRAGLSQKQLAGQAGLGKTVIFDIEKGKETVQFNSLLKVLRSLNIKLKFSNSLAD